MAGVSITISERAIRGAGLCGAALYAIFIVWLYASQPQTMAEITGGITASVGVYAIDERAFADGLELFRRDEFAAARAAFERADPAGRDSTTQFYIAYAYYREGWGRLYHDDRKYALGLERIDRAIAAAPAGRITVSDPDLAIHNADELRAELVAGMKVDETDFNPMKVFRRRR
jgi:hypothetical protein